MTWNPRRTGWMGRPRAAPQPPPAPVVAEEAVVIVPALPMFSPASVAQLLGVNRGTVHNWLERGKLGFIRDNLNERYILREELFRFVREFLQRSIRE